MSRVSALGAKAALLIVPAVMLAGCANFRPTQQAFAPDEYEQRHPIRLTDTMRHLDIFANGRALDARQQRDLAEFGAEYARSGRGPLMIAAPAGPAGAYGIETIRAALGVKAPVRITHYRGDPAIGASPVRVSFARFGAEVASTCGLWPEDLAGTREAQTWHNRPYHNQGCAYQTMMAAQVADPIDFVRPRPEGRSDVVKRVKDIEALRKDQDPSTQWRKDDAKIKEAQQ
ncbi:MAG: CpaD family pilus assembly protein [Proteobacteria bacterium]|nr:CpaD family pilus assembly protein [Pseudomonadota bacterium]